MPIARAVRIQAPGGPEVLTLDRISIDDPGPGQVLIEVAAAGLNRADLLQRMGAYAAPPGVPADVPGLEFAGRVAMLGAGVTAFGVGDAVMGIVGGGGMATHLVVHERELLRVPDGLSLTEAAAVPEAFLTAYDALFSQAELAAGESVLIHAIPSGVGTAALQLARHAGARVIGTSRTADKLTRAAEVGAFHPVHVTGGVFQDAVRAASGGGVNVLLDMVGGAYLEENLASLTLRGRMVVIGLMGGREASIPLGTLLRRRLTMHGSVLRSRPLEEKASLIQRFGARVAPLFGSGALRPVIDDVLPMSEIQAAHTRMGNNETFGKLVLSWT
ncbi:MAG: NAD(P)H-quinone oxidoreductase [Sandaracinaceae bacterium]